MAGDSAPATPSGFGDNRGIMFSIKTGNVRYQCTLQDRASYERVKATRTNSMESTKSSSSASSTTSSK